VLTDDSALVSAAQAGDRAALDTLLRRHHPRLLALCLRLTGNPTDADDACQEALIALVRGLARFDGRSSFSTWAYRVTTNTCIDELRRRRRRPIPGLAEGPSGPLSGKQGPSGPLSGELGPSGPLSGVTGPSGPLSGVTGPPDEGDAVATRLDIEAALAQLAPEFRVAVVLRDLCRLSYAEIADVVDAPIGTVRSRIARGRALLLPLLAATPVAHGVPFGHAAGIPFGHGAGNPSATPERPTP